MPGHRYHLLLTGGCYRRCNTRLPTDFVINRWLLYRDVVHACPEIKFVNNRWLLYRDVVHGYHLLLIGGCYTEM